MRNFGSISLALFFPNNIILLFRSLKFKIYNLIYLYDTIEDLKQTIVLKYYKPSLILEKNAQIKISRSKKLEVY